MVSESKNQSGMVKNMPELDLVMIDEDYEAKVNMLIPHATSEANRMIDLHKVGDERRVGVDGNIYIFDWFTYYYHRAMNRMCYEAGLRTWK